MVGPDGMILPQSHYIERSVRSALIGAKRLTFSFEQPRISEFRAEGLAAELLASDLASEKWHDHAMHTLIAAAARLFMDSLQDGAALNQLRTSTASEPSRFDNNGWINGPTKVAFNFGCLRSSFAPQVASRAAHIILAAEQARLSLGARLPMHPAFAAIEGVTLHKDWGGLVKSASTLLSQYFRPPELTPVGHSNKLDISDWKPGETVSQLIQEHRRRREARSLFTSRTHDRRGDQLVEALQVGWPGARSSDLVDAVLPVQYQALLAYEGLYAAMTNRRRAENPSLAFGTSGSKDWSTLFNNLMERIPNRREILLIGR